MSFPTFDAAYLRISVFALYWDFAGIPFFTR